MRIEDITPEFLHQNGINPEGMVFSQHHLPYNRRLKDFSRELRQHGEKSEAMLWKRLKSDRQMRVIGLEIIRVRDAEVRSNPDGIANYIGEQCRVIRDGNFG